jgi:predicted nucleotidyltransferase
MSHELPLLVQRTLQRLIRAFAPDQIVLFGSYAKGTTHPFSDVDFLLVVANLAAYPASRNRRARQLAADCFPRVDVVFATPQEVADAKTAKSSFLLTILETGIVIHRRT